MGNIKSLFLASCLLFVWQGCGSTNLEEMNPSNLQEASALERMSLSDSDTYELDADRVTSEGEETPEGKPGTIVDPYRSCRHYGTYSTLQCGELYIYADPGCTFVGGKCPDGYCWNQECK